MLLPSLLSPSARGTPQRFAKTHDDGRPSYCYVPHRLCRVYCVTTMTTYGGRHKLGVKSGVLFSRINPKPLITRPRMKLRLAAANPDDDCTTPPCSRVVLTPVVAYAKYSTDPSLRATRRRAGINPAKLSTGNAPSPTVTTPESAPLSSPPRSSWPPCGRGTARRWASCRMRRQSVSFSLRSSVTAWLAWSGDGGGATVGGDWAVGDGTDSMAAQVCSHSPEHPRKPAH